jgi:predicted Ser/Thr protein kinase
MARYEAAVLGHCQDLQGVPRLVPVDRPGVLAHEFVPGEPLHRNSRVDDEFFPRLFRLLGQIHKRGVAYVDLEKCENILVGEEGAPWLIDFQVAFYVPPRLGGETTLVRKVRGWLQRADIYHARKHLRRVRPDLLDAEAERRSRIKPWPVRLGNSLVAPYKKLRRYLKEG